MLGGMAVGLTTGELTAQSGVGEGMHFTWLTNQSPPTPHAVAIRQPKKATATSLVPNPHPSPLGELFHLVASPRNALPVAVTAALVIALFVRRNPLHAAQHTWWKMLSRLGLAGASVRAAELYNDSHYTRTLPGTYKRGRERRKYLKRAAEAGHVGAALRLGTYYLNRSAGDLHGLMRAERYLRQAADGGLTEAFYELGKLHQLLWRFTEAYDFFQRAAQTGHVEAMCAAAGVAERHLVHALGTEAVLELYRRAAEAGSGVASLRLAELLTDGKLTAPDYREALRWLRSKPCREHQEARANLKLQEAYGFDPDATESQVVEARLDLATQYWQGKGSQRNPRLAWKWAALAAETGDPRAEYLVGKFLLDAVGVLQDAEEAEKHLEAAAKHGIGIAQFELARLLSEPGASPARREQAYAWASLAAIQDEPEYVSLRDRLAAGMDAAACRRAVEFARQLSLNGNASPLPDPPTARSPWVTALNLVQASQRAGAAVRGLAKT